MITYTYDEASQRTRMFEPRFTYVYHDEGTLDHWRRPGGGDIVSLGGVQVLRQRYVGGCAVMIRREVYERAGPVPCRSTGAGGPVLESGWTTYQERIAAMGLINGYPWPPIHVDHMEDTRSPHCVLSAEHQQYKQAMRGMDLEQFTEELCVWRPH